MKLSKNSESLISFFLENKLINTSPSYLKETNKRIIPTITSFYREILESEAFLKEQKRKAYKETGKSLYEYSIRSIVTPSQMARPSSYGGKLFPEEVKEHIENYSLTEITYKLRYINRSCTFYFIVEEPIDSIHIKTYDRYVDQILLWLHIMNKTASSRCATVFKLYIYFTSLEKRKPTASGTYDAQTPAPPEVLNSNHVNTAFTSVCPIVSEIVLFRKEEWFKVFIHETFHNFALDFAGMNNTLVHKQILQMFPVKSEVNIFESYTEFWAEIIHALFCSYFLTKKEEKKFVTTALTLIQLERTYSFFQMVKTLDHMDITYKELININSPQQQVNDKYKEETSVLAYYIIKTVLFDKYQEFILWCKRHNGTLYDFKNTLENQQAFIEFIRQKYRSRGFLNDVRVMEDLYPLLKTNVLNKNRGTNKKLDYLIQNMRMSICEMG
jgi:hypothetical protein